MHEKVQRTFYFVVSTPGGVAEAVINVNFTTKHQNKRVNTNANINNNLPIFSSSANYLNRVSRLLLLLLWILVGCH
jgi:hypothetical protein